MPTVDELKKQLEATKSEFEEVRARLYRCDGVIQLLTHLIAEEEKSTADLAVDPSA